MPTPGDQPHPPGLTLNKDTGGITGVPTTKGHSKFTITGRNGGGVADARRPRSPSSRS
ncbi:putative Ig domain-containing protein [Streptomyces sp. NPDC056831]|uniref:putative Ig domain-containing protein n=1 Tax=Streptomyces sp. NPDC056831 TaxID=3345954 RepID=UPI003699B195